MVVKYHQPRFVSPAAIFLRPYNISPVSLNAETVSSPSSFYLPTNPTLPVGTVGRGHYSDGLSGDIANSRHSAVGDLPNTAFAVLAIGGLNLNTEQNRSTDYHSTHSKIS